jgi:hypothetical protein
MSTSVTITNTTDAELQISEIYSQLGPAGSPTASLTFTRSVAELDSMVALKTLVFNGTVTVVVTESTDNVDILSIPLEQHGNVGTLAVDSVAVVTHAVTFANAYPVGVSPVITFGVQQGTHTDWKAGVYARSVTNTGFTLALDVTTQSGTSGEKGSVNWVASY